MALLHCRADGNWTTAATWGLCDATGSVDSQSGNTALTVAFITSATFTPGAITVDGVAVKIASRALSPSGTITVRLATGGVAVAGTSVTINVSDIPDDVVAPSNGYRGCSIGWFMFKFGAPVTLLAATLYTVQANTSVASQVNLFNNGTPGNHSRLLRTTTTQAPAAGDSMFIGGEWTAAATKTDRSVALDTTTTTDFGSASTTLASLGVSKGGTLTRAASATAFRLSGCVNFWLESANNLQATPSTSFKWEFDCAADGDFGIVTYAGFTFGGSDPWGTGFTRTRLAANAAALATSLTTADSTGWKNTNVIVISGTKRLITDAEERPLNADAIGTGLAFTTGLVTAKDGSAADKVQADIINISRNCWMTVVTTTATAYINVVAGNLDCEWALFEYIGTGTAGKAGFDLVTGGTHTFDFCAFARCEDDLFFPAASSTGTVTLTDCVTWDTSTTTGGAVIAAASANSYTWTLTRCSLIADGRASSTGIYINAGGGNLSTLTMTGTRISGFAGTGIGSCRLDGPVELTITDCELSNNTAANGALFINAANIGCRITRLWSWRNNGPGVGIVNSFDLGFEACECYGNSTIGMTCDDAYVRVLDCVFANETGFAQTVGVEHTGAENGAGNYHYHGCVFSPIGGTRIAATTDIAFTTTNTRYAVTVSGCTFGGATDISTATLEPGSTLAIQSRDGVYGAHSHRTFGYGQIDYETGTVGETSPAMKMTPEAALRLFSSQPMGVAVESSKQITFTAKVRKSAAYNGAMAPRLLLLANGSMGIAVDVVLASLTAAADTWETLTGQSAAVTADGVLEVVVQCQGTAGAVYVDDFTAVST